MEVSDWATPIVCVPKTDGSVPICGDYKGTVNRAIQTKQFPIPTLEEIRGRASSWKKFTKVDLRSAYQQLVLNGEAQKLRTINSHKAVSDTDACHLEFHPALQFGNDSMCKS